MRTHDGRINHLQCRVGQAAAGERLQHHIPDATVSPAAELPKNRIPVAELLRQIAPRRAGPHQPKRRVHHTAMVARRTASATDQKRFEIRPLIIGQQSANQGCPPQRAALNQFSIPASIDLSTRPNLGVGGSNPSGRANPPDYCRGIGSNRICERLSDRPVSSGRGTRRGLTDEQPVSHPLLENAGSPPRRCAGSRPPAPRPRVSHCLLI